jgi:hypothetical protein
VCALPQRPDLAAHLNDSRQVHLLLMDKENSRLKQLLQREQKQNADLLRRFIGTAESHESINF